MQVGTNAPLLLQPRGCMCTMTDWHQRDGHIIGMRQQEPRQVIDLRLPSQLKVIAHRVVTFPPTNLA